MVHFAIDIVASEPESSLSLWGSGFLVYQLWRSEHSSIGLFLRSIQTNTPGFHCERILLCIFEYDKMHFHAVFCWLITLMWNHCGLNTLGMTLQDTQKQLCTAVQRNLVLLVVLPVKCYLWTAPQPQSLVASWLRFPNAALRLSIYSFADRAL